MRILNSPARSGDLRIEMNARKSHLRETLRLNLPHTYYCCLLLLLSS